MGIEERQTSEGRLKILLIGNGPSATNQKLGKEIDEFPIVVRFNSYRTEGYEEYVGSKTDIWITTDIFPAWHKEYKEVVLCSFNRSPDNSLLLKMKEYYPDTHNFPEWAWEETVKAMGFSAPSTGAVAVTYFKDYEIYIYGFNFFAGQKHHYGDKVKACHHSARREMEYFRRLMVEGKVRPFHDYLKPYNYEILHNIYPNYGIGGGWFKNHIKDIAFRENVKTILDYGCGKGFLVKLLNEEGFNCFGYDPHVEEHSSIPQKVDMVVSTDFFEHIQGDEIDEVILNILSLKPKIQFHAISNRRAVQILPDGSNAHSTIKSPEWWKERLKELGNVIILGHNENNNFTMYEVKKEK